MSPTRGRLGGLDRVPALAQLEALQLCEAALVDRDIAELAALKAAPRMLCLDANRFTAFGLRAVLRSALARRLEWISVDYVALGDEVAPLLAELSSLRVVSLAQTNIQGKALRTMVERLTAIEVLRIDSARDLRPSDVAGFAALSRLRALGLGSTGLGDEGVEALCAIASSLPTLRELDLHRCQIESRGAAALARSAFELESLKLYGNCLDQAARDALLEKFGGAVLF